jgi:hypothetical protein
MMRYCSSSYLRLSLTFHLSIASLSPEPVNIKLFYLPFDELGEKKRNEFVKETSQFPKFIIMQKANHT